MQPALQDAPAEPVAASAGGERHRTPGEWDQRHLWGAASSSVVCLNQCGHLCSCVCLVSTSVSGFLIVGNTQQSSMKMFVSGVGGELKEGESGLLWETGAPQGSDKYKHGLIQGLCRSWKVIFYF